MERRGENWHWAERAVQLPCRWTGSGWTPPWTPGNCCSCSASGLPVVSLHLGVALGGGLCGWGNPRRALTVEVGAAGVSAAGQHVPAEGAAQGPGLCVHHRPCSSLLSSPGPGQTQHDDAHNGILCNCDEKRYHRHMFNGRKYVHSYIQQIFIENLWYTKHSSKC